MHATKRKMEFLGYENLFTLNIFLTDSKRKLMTFKKEKYEILEKKFEKFEEN